LYSFFRQRHAVVASAHDDLESISAEEKGGALLRNATIMIVR
jgi:hypothetical protein